MTSDSLKASASIITMFPAATDHNGLYTFLGKTNTHLDITLRKIIISNAAQHRSRSSTDMCPESAFIQAGFGPHCPEAVILGNVNSISEKIPGEDGEVSCWVNLVVHFN